MNGFTKKAIGDILNNAVAYTQNPATLKKPLTEGRLRKLRDYTRALIQPALDHLEEGGLIAEELVYVFTCAALLFHAYRILKTDKLPMIPATKDFFDKRVKDELPDIEVKCPDCKKKFYI